MKKIHSATAVSHDQHKALTKNDFTRKIFLSFVYVKKNNSLCFFLVSETKRKMELESLFQLASLDWISRIYNFDFRSISKQDFRIVCQQDLPDLFLSYSFTLDRFTCLQSLSLYEIHSAEIMETLLLACHHLPNIAHLNLIDVSFHRSTQYNNQNTRQFFFTFKWRYRLERTYLMFIQTHSF